jgi:hypothetical protein
MKYLEEKSKKHNRLKPEEMIFNVRIEDINKTNHKFEKLKLSEMTCVSLSACGFCSGVLSSFQVSDSFFTTIHLVLCSVTTFLLLYAIYWRTKRQLKWEQARMIYSNIDTLISTKKHWFLAFELLINLVHPVYGMQFYEFSTYNDVIDVDITYKLVPIITCIMMLRVYHLVRCFFTMSKFKTSRFQRLCKIYGNDPDNWFTFKCMMNETPVVIITCMFAFGIFLGAYALYVFESPTKDFGGKDFTKFGNAIWCVIVTMATVGYGDFYPITGPGRLAGFFTCIWGVVTMSLTAVTFSNLLSMNLGESTSLTILQRLWYKEELKKHAAFVLTSSVRLRLMMKNQVLESKVKKQFQKFRYYLKSFQNFKIQQKQLYDFDSYSDRIEMKLLDIIANYEKSNEYLEKSNEIVEFFHRVQSYKTEN